MATTVARQEEDENEQDMDDKDDRTRDPAGDALPAISEVELAALEEADDAGPAFAHSAEVTRTSTCHTVWIHTRLSE